MRYDKEIDWPMKAIISKNSETNDKSEMYMFLSYTKTIRYEINARIKIPDTAP